MSTLLAAFLSLVPQSGDVARIEHIDPQIRLLVVQLVGKDKNVAAIRPLIGRLEATDERADIQAAAQQSLVDITGRTDIKDAAGWRAWWVAEGRSLYPDTFSADSLAAQIKDDVIKDITKARQDVRAISTVLGVAIILFIIVMFFFVGHVSSKIKGWRELVNRAEIYVKHGQELTERTDKIAAELDAKKAEVAAAIENLRKEHEEGISRRSDDLGTELAHQLRTELQTLRQKAERELDQTVTDLKTQLETTARRAAADVRDRLAK